jgi:hypothetical protein
MGTFSDFWIMNADGSDKRQLSFFNKPGHAEYANGDRMTCCLATFSPDGKQLLGGVQTSIIRHRGNSYMVTLR